MKPKNQFSQMANKLFLVTFLVATGVQAQQLVPYPGLPAQPTGGSNGCGLAPPPSSKWCQTQRGYAYADFWHVGGDGVKPPFVNTRVTKEELSYAVMFGPCDTLEVFDTFELWKRPFVRAGIRGDIMVARTLCVPGEGLRQATGGDQIRMRIRRTDPIPSEYEWRYVSRREERKTIPGCGGGPPGGGGGGGSEPPLTGAVQCPIGTQPVFGLSPEDCNARANHAWFPPPGTGLSGVCCRRNPEPLQTLDDLNFGETEQLKSNQLDSNGSGENLR